MARRKLFGVATEEGTGNSLVILDGADVQAYQAGTSTPIDMYAAESGGIPTTITTDAQGRYAFWIEIVDANKKIKLEITKVAHAGQTIDGITLYEDAGQTLTDVTNFNGKLSALDINVQIALETLDDHTHAHSEITSVGVDDHHAQLHHAEHEDGGGDTIDVSNLSGVLADRQNPTSHAHDGADGSGTVAHSDTTGRTTDDHHAQSHTLQSHTGDLAYTQIDDIVAITGAGDATHLPRADHKHTGADGSPLVDINNSETSSATPTSTTSNAWTPIAGMTVTPAAGTYVVSFSSSGDGTASGGDMDYRLAVAGTGIAHSVRDMGWGGGIAFQDARTAMHTQAVVTVNGAQAIEVEYQTQDGTFNVYERSLILIRVG